MASEMVEQLDFILEKDKETVGLNAYIEDFQKVLEGIEEPLFRIKSMNEEIARSDRYKELIKSRPALKALKFDINKDGIITDEEFASVKNNEEEISIALRDQCVEDRKLEAFAMIQENPEFFRSIGRIAPGAVAYLAGTYLSMAEKERKEAGEFCTHLLILEQLKQRIAELNNEISALDEEIVQLREEIARDEQSLADEFGEDWEEKLKRGEIDPNDPRVQRILENRPILRQKLEHRAKLDEQKRTAEKRYGALRNKTNPSLSPEAQATLEAERTQEKLKSQSLQQKKITFEGDNNIEGQEFKAEVEDEYVQLNPDKEVEQFTKSLDAAKNIQDPLARLREEQRLVNTL